MSKKMGRPRIDPDIRKTVNTTITTTEATKKAVQAEARNQDRTVSALYRIVITAYLKAGGDES